MKFDAEWYEKIYHGNLCSWIDEVKSASDFLRLYTLHLYSAFFVTTAKSNFQFQRIYSRKVDKSTGLRCDQTIRLTGRKSFQYYPEKLRRISCVDEETSNRYVFLTNNFAVSALVITLLYKCRWNIELFL